MSSRPKQPPARGRPRGSTSFDANVAAAFGRIARQARLDAGVSQEAMAYMSALERSHYGRIERGLTLPTLSVLLKIADALGYQAAALVDRVQSELDQAP